ncbi:hypothetical protein BCR42DRAFT_407939 [Absidia repens]|uniref:SWIRM domain-containing protein n=1 Tax=Absidia repens TaxID=90262 RepID=A0A1X2ISX6_9FUNG|nr:hypothetical protein BCR42DRAFT_407939 [Absidia repens]
MNSIKNESTISTTYQSNLMSPPMTPKTTNHNETTQTYNDITLLPSSGTNNDDDYDITYEQRRECLGQLEISDSGSGCPSSLLYRKASLPHSIRAMTLANHDPFDTIGRRFSIPLEKQQHHYFQHKQQYIPRRRSHRTKSLPRRSPTLTNTSSHEIFTINVFDRPLTSSPATNSPTLKLQQCHHQCDLPTATTKSSPSVPSLSVPGSTLSTSSQSATLLISPATSVPCIPSSSSSSASTSSTPSLSSSSSSSSILPTSSTCTPLNAGMGLNSSKVKANTSFYDHVDLSVDDQYVYDLSWRPLWESIDKKPSVRVVWKGSPLSIHSLPYYDHLHPKEKTMASTLRLTPEQYLKCKRALILSAQVFYEHGMQFRKSDAQKVCRIDVNKTSCLWGAFNRLGWLLPH